MKKEEKKLKIVKNIPSVIPFILIRKENVYDEYGKLISSTTEYGVSKKAIKYISIDMLLGFRDLEEETEREEYVK